MHPFLLPALLAGSVASMFLVLRGAPLPPAPLLGLLAVAFVAPLRTPRWATLLAVLAGGILVGSLRAQTALRHERSARETAAALVHDPSTDAPLWIGTVLDGARPVEPPTRVRLRVHSVRFADGTTVQHHGTWAVTRIESGPLLAPGDRVALRAVRLPDRGALHPWTWDPAAAQRVRGVVGTLRATGEPVLLSGVPSWRALPDRARQRVERALFDGLSPETAGVAVAMVTGTRDAIPAATRTLFADTGAAHVLAVSGMHLALLSAALFGAVERGLRWIPRLCARWESRRIAAWGMVPCVVAYVVFTGAPVSAVRAGLMAGLVFLAIGLGRPSGSRHGLLLATWVLLLWNPWWLFDAGFQLSVTATFALVFLAPLPPPRSGTRMGAKPAESPTGG
jgi:ComEC/Rec2-related protein